MIQTKQQLRDCLKIEKKNYVAQNRKRNLQNRLLGGSDVDLWFYIKAMRKREFYFNNRNKNPWYAFLNLFYARRFNCYGRRLGIECGFAVFDTGVEIYHAQGTVINGDAKIGKNCKLHGANVIGNMGNNLGVPVIGDNVRLGAKAMVLGNIRIADDVQIGAGAVVLHSCDEKGALLIGCPAKPYHKGSE